MGGLKTGKDCNFSLSDIGCEIIECRNISKVEKLARKTLDISTRDNFLLIHRVISGSALDLVLNSSAISTRSLLILKINELSVKSRSDIVVCLKNMNTNAK